MTIADSIRIITAVLLLGGAFLTGALSHQRADDHSRAQGFVRAGLTLEQLLWAVSLIGAVFEWPAEIRLTPLAFIAGVTLVGLVWDSVDTIRTHPKHGPFGALARILDRRRH